jgi:hypothetical protein
VDLDSHEIRTVLSRPYSVTGATASPDGERIYFAGDPVGSANSIDTRLYSSDREGDDVYELNTEGLAALPDPP